ncbi:cold-responsive protein kinase 1-like [Lycium barbarum]|uniref:cold-responsive protein kinase 1-like n=1 Tax=Lycium barbarum TaxID=112863 RepID=UPI00293EA695|nr:cold-responsive protein kinase 1-like [Lycium barbarum]XP_060187992.1 cold-responsive protein kinase 1-like [Lycium barbarum]
MNCGCFGASTQRQDTRDTGGCSTTKTKKFSYSELRKATNNFHQSNKIGRGGFGTVYKGTLRSGIEVAVKPLSAESRQGLREFLTEIETISDVTHPNLVELIGYCLDGNNRILVYEYLDNTSLDRALFGSGTRNVQLDWETRAAICLGTATGLAYLHEELVPHIVHRDIKASNILLDKDYKPKIGDFGLAKLFPDNITHITTQIKGTTGYLAPEYVMGRQLTSKADVYSFGVLILETVSGRSSGSGTWQGQKLLLESAWQLYEEGKLLELVDPELGDFPEKEVLKYIKVALFCTQETANRRPMMSQVLDMLTKNIKLNENELTPPGFFQDSGGSSSTQLKLKSSESSTSHQMSSVPLTITQVTPR